MQINPYSLGVVPVFVFAGLFAAPPLLSSAAVVGASVMHTGHPLATKGLQQCAASGERPVRGRFLDNPSPLNPVTFVRRMAKKEE